MERPRHFEDYAVGEERKTYGRTITETDFVVHAGHTGDFFPHHMDAEAMKASQWGQRIAHGTMTFAIGIGLTASEINPLAFTYGYERLRFPKPVFIGDTIHTVLTISGARRRPQARRPRPRHRAGAGAQPARRDGAGLRPRSGLCRRHGRRQHDRREDPAARLGIARSTIRPARSRSSTRSSRIRPSTASS